MLVMKFRNRVNTYSIKNTKLLSGIEDCHNGPSDAMHNPSPATQEHQSDTYVFTMMMEILPKLTSNKLYGRFNTAAGNPVKETLLKLSLPSHKSILTDSKNYVKMDVEVPGSSRLKDS
ncbi:hypothetical protein Tco_0155421 [Tanacetum coccineum]